MALLLVLAVDGNFNKVFILNDILCDVHKYNKVKFYGLAGCVTMLFIN